MSDSSSWPQTSNLHQAGNQKKTIPIEEWGVVACDLSMTCKLRIEYPGAIYHVMNRGDHREDVFRDDEDWRRFLGTLGEACVKTDWRVHAYCLMA
ncbi:MAG: hypothetical protein AAB676_21765 [Verrucomicrobiota bacterium]